MNTGTLTTLLNKREYTREESIVLLYFFTNLDKNVYAATNNLSNQLWAFLVGQYSRSSLSMRDRFLKLFEDSEVALEKGIISESEHVSLSDLAKAIEGGKDTNLGFFEKKASDFLKKWGVDYGHNSLKDADRIRFAIEGVSIVFTKIIEAPFPALGDFQEKSTRYLYFGQDNLIFPEDVKASEYGQEIVDYSKELMAVYGEYMDKVKDILIQNNVLDRDSFSTERAYNNTLNAKCFDILRYMLPNNVSTSLGASFSTRTLESHLSYMLSHPMEEVRVIAKAMHEEALKLSPGLLSRVGVNEYEVKRRGKLENYVKEMLDITGDKEEVGFYKGIDDKDRVNIIFEGDLDGHIAASLLFEGAREHGISYDEALEIVENNGRGGIEEIISLALQDRGQFDRMPRAMQHSSVMFEFLMDFGAYRDIQRHRASKQLWQGATAIHGYDYPEYIDLPGMEEFKAKYDEMMEKGVHLCRKVVKNDTYISEYAAALGHLIRMTFEMDPGQMAYTTELRTTPQGHTSYVDLMREAHRQMAELAPVFSKYVRVGLDLENSRQKQEEKAEKKRQALGV